MQVLARKDDDHWQRVADEVVNTWAVQDRAHCCVWCCFAAPAAKVELLPVWDHLIVDGVGPGTVTRSC
jgi:hypothetical protein